MLDLRSLAVGYRNTRGTVLSGIDLAAEPGDFICILGRNGSGKSTLMRTIAGLQTSLDGVVLLDGEGVASMRPATRARRIAVVLTERQFNPGLRVEDVIALARQPFTSWRGGLTDDDRAAIADAVAVTGVEPFLRRFFTDVSDGERQRVMIARAVAQTPRLLVLDEITAFLDLPSRMEIMALLRSQAKQKGQVVLLSSHDLDLSLQLADSVWLLDGDGGFSVGTPEALSESGSIGRAFDTEAIRFSSSQGRFEIQMPASPNP
ncbi:MAG: ABC transporter ATP-binding protein [Holophagales bacterium]|nr:ABC transporter ATP-binding protein [Holophagales bacterium]MYJ25047.1 ABC transporter ATP-binding protein [Holophagales bacterium]